MEPIRVWKFKDAPEELRELSDDKDKGYEEYVAVLPKGYIEENGMPMFLNSATVGIKLVRIIKKNDETVLIGIRVSRELEQQWILD